MVNGLYPDGALLPGTGLRAMLMMELNDQSVQQIDKIFGKPGRNKKAVNTKYPYRYAQKLLQGTRHFFKL